MFQGRYRIMSTMIRGRGGVCVGRTFCQRRESEDGKGVDAKLVESRIWGDDMRPWRHLNRMRSTWVGA
jgi:hypothetical protein